MNSDYMPTEGIKDIQTKFKQGIISRNEFRLKMQQWHNCLRQYQALINGSDVSSIEITKSELILMTDNIKIIWNPEDVGNAPNILATHGTYESEEKRFLMDAAVDAQVIFDVGANVGFYSLLWASRMSNGEIHAFEPVPSTFQWLTRNVEINQLGKLIKPNNFGLGNESKRIPIYLPNVSGCSAASIKNLHPDEKSKEIIIQIETMDQYFESRKLSNLDLIKADVEGAELFVLKGGDQTIRKHKPLIFLELLRKWSKPFGYHPNDVISLLKSYGYDCYTIDNNNLIPFSFMTEETIQTNFFFADPEKHKKWLLKSRLI
jgi:FkbM family methyltransferase